MLKLFLTLAWRNLFRNQRRSLLTSLVISIGLAALIFQDALLLGMQEKLKEQATRFLGHAQIHHQNYLQNPDAFIEEETEILKILDTEKSVEKYFRRCLSPAMISSPKKAEAILLYGIEDEPLRQQLIEGKELKDGIFIGKELAKSLKVRVHDKIIVTLCQAESHEIVQELFRVDGFLQLGQKSLDEKSAFIPLARAQELLKSTKIHEISLRLKEPTPKDFFTRLSLGKSVAKSWLELLPGMKSIVELSSYSGYISALILSILVFFIILNSLYMALFERAQEFGMLKALGTKPFQIFSLIVFEAAFLSLLSILAGIFLAFGLLAFFGSYGIDYSGISVGHVVIESKIYPLFQTSQLIYPGFVFAFTLFCACFPAKKAASIHPIDVLEE